jgi:PAS domain S-box-containing protein
MSAAPPALQPRHPIRQAAALFAEYDVDTLPVLDGSGRLVGTVSRRQVLRVASRGDDLDAPLEGVLEPCRDTAMRPDDQVPEALLSASLPVVSGEKLIGMLTPGDQARMFLARLSSTCNELKTVIDSMHNAIVVVDQRGVVTTFNRSAEKVFSRRADEVVGKSVKATFFTSRLLETLISGQAATSQKICLDGKWFLSNRTPIMRGGKVVGAVAVLQDISELEAVSRELESVRQLNAELDAIIESSFDGLVVTDAQGTIVRVNRAHERITGLPMEAVLERKLADLIAEGIMERSATLEALEKGETVTAVQEFGNGRVALVTGNPVFDGEGRVFRVVTNVRDITDLNLLQQQLEQASGLSRHYETELQQMRIRYADDRLVISSPKMRDLMQVVMRAAQVDSTILIQGESGVGKELIAETIHAHSPRRKGPFIRVNCGAIPANLLESELFGYEDGAFTGARKEGKAGLFELASQGTLFLDEIGELPLGLQVKLLRVLQEKEFTRVGGVRPVRVDLRIVAGTNRDLEQMVKDRAFREDLFYRLHVVPIQVPPLRERREEIPSLVAHFLNKFNQQYGMRKHVAPEVLDVLLEHRWPGNVRELENLVERLVVTTPHDIIRREDLPASLAAHSRQGLSPLDGRLGSEPLKLTMERVERQILERAFARCKTTRGVARELGVNQSTVVRKAAKYHIAFIE